MKRLLVLVAVVAVSVAACGGGTDTPAQPKKLRFALIPKSLDIPVFNYAKLHPLFPHEPTSDQLYTESQFESYRELGSHVMGTILEGLSSGATLEDLFTKVEGELGSPSSCG